MPAAWAVAHYSTLTKLSQGREGESEITERKRESRPGFSPLSLLSTSFLASESWLWKIWRMGCGSKIHLATSSFTGARKENWRESRGWVPDLKDNSEGCFSHINSIRQRDILAGDAAGTERLKWREMLLSKLGVINALGTKGLLSGFVVNSYSPVCPWQQVKYRQ